MRKSIMAANWKMNKTSTEATEFAQQFLPLVSDLSDDCEVIIFPASTAIPAVNQVVKGSNVLLGAQNMHFEKSGAFTGELCSAMLIDEGCKYVIVGHSERREYFGETNQLCNKKIHAVFEAGLRPIYCIGETLEQREQRITLPLVEIQVRQGLASLSPEQVEQVVIAYEPVWAIGTGKTATTEQAQQVHASIRQVLEMLYDEKTAAKVRIQYGGSVKPANVDELMSMPDIDGALVGGASLDPESFARIALFETK